MTNAVDIRIFFRNGDTKLGIWPKRARSHCRWFKLQRQTVIPRLDKNFFRVRFDRLTPGEKNFFRAMANLGPGPYRTGDIATTRGVEIEASVRYVPS